MNPDAPPRRGRPRDPERVRRVLEAAAQQFVQQGFERTSIESVAHASGVSKMTVYSYFPSKEALFDACIEDRCAGLFDLFLNTGLDPQNPRAALTQVATLFLQLLRDDQVLAVHRMMFASAGVHQDVCDGFYRSGPAICVAHLGRYMATAHAAGTLCTPEPERAADQFLSLFLGTGHLKALLGLGRPAADEDAQLVRDNVALFLRACAAPPATAG